jgi:hypothetical protein
MTLDEAIKHCEDVAAKCFVERLARNHSGRCGFEHLELAAWLRELKAYKEQEPCNSCCGGDQKEKAKLCQKSYLAGLEHRQELCEDAISREAVLAMSDYIGETSTYDDPLGKVEEVVRVKDIMALPPVIPAQSWKPMSNKQWIDFLVKSWDISRTSAKNMLHVMMSVKKEDNFKKQFSGAKMKGADDEQ